MSVSVRTFGKYLLDEEIARGGMSRVYLARLRGLGGFEKRLVVKQILPELASDPRFVSMFVHEAKTVVQMSHPHIAPVYELGVVDGVYFLAMEYVEGATLAEILRDGPIAPELAAQLGIEICDALHYACSRFDLVHRDVTPRNVIVDRAGHSRLLDFGIAAPVQDEGGAELFGTPGYLSPEHLEGRGLSAASDVFSLGAVLFEAVTGRRAFVASTVDEARASLAGEGPTLDDLPAGLDAILRRALARRPEDRTASAHALGRALRGWLAGEAPEGVGPELGHRAEKALLERTRRLDSGSMAVEPLTPGEVRTLATSRLLEALLVEGGEAAPTSDEGDDGPGTAPIPGRVSRPDLSERGPELSEPGTAPIAGRASRPELRAELGASVEPVGESVHAAEEGPAPPTPSRLEHPGEPTGPPPPSAGIAAERPALTPAEAPLRETPRESVPALARRPGSERRWVLALVAALALGGAWAVWPRGTSTPASTPRAEPEARTLDAPPDPTPLAEPARLTEPEEAPAPEARPEPPPDPAPAPAPLARGAMTVNAVPWGEVAVDGRAVGTTPLRRLSLRPGPHRIEVRCPPLGREVTASFELTPGQTATVIADLSRDPPRIEVRGAGAD